MWLSILIPVLVRMPLSVVVIYGGIVGVLFVLHQFIIRKLSTKVAYVVFSTLLMFLTIAVMIRLSEDLLPLNNEEVNSLLFPVPPGGCRYRNIFTGAIMESSYPVPWYWQQIECWFV